MLLDILLWQLSSPPDFWRDGIWQSWGVLVAVFFGFVGLGLWGVDRQKQQRRKQLTHAVISDAPIAQVSASLRKRVEILFDGVPSADLRLMILQLKNSGNSPIERNDYDEPVRFEFEAPREVVDGEVLFTQPEDLIDAKDAKTFLTVNGNNVILKPLLLNPKETITLKVLLKGQKGQMRARARIVGGTISVEEKNLLTYSTPYYVTWAGLLILLGVLLGTGTLLFYAYLNPVTVSGKLLPYPMIPAAVVSTVFVIAFTSLIFFVPLLLLISSFMKPFLARAKKYGFLKPRYENM